MAETDVGLLLEAVASKAHAATVRLYRTLAWEPERALQSNPHQEPAFRRFPEVAQFELNRLLVVPLRSKAELFGVLTLGRRLDNPFADTEVQHVEQAAQLLTAVLQRDSLELKLEERKLVERAKGILQKRRRLSEEQAYFALRNQSRRERLSMARIARTIIDSQAAETPGARPSNFHH
jgi:uroporphyrinogen-III synthase